MQEEQKREETEAEAAAASQIQADQHAANINPTGPNIIGNVEDMQSMQLAQEEETAQLGGADVVMDHTFEDDGNKFKDITGDLKRSKRKRGKSPFWQLTANLVYSYDNLTFILFKIHVATKRNFSLRTLHNDLLWLFWKLLQSLCLHWSPFC